MASPKIDTAKVDMREWLLYMTNALCSPGLADWEYTTDMLCSFQVLSPNISTAKPLNHLSWNLLQQSLAHHLFGES
jgi:hypothetical protein